MSRFDNLAQRQKAQLTPEIIRKHYLNEVLMERGVNPIVPGPVLEELPPRPMIQDREYFTVALKHGGYNSTTVVFEDKAALDTFRSLGALCMNWDGSGKYSVHTPQDTEVAVRMLPDHREAQHHQAVLKAREDISRRNEGACQEFDRLMGAVQKVEDDLFTQVREAREEEHVAVRVNATAEEYLRLCDGDADKAHTFLLKVFSEEDIQRSITWFKQPANTPWAE